jgi:hypothetical protein
MLVRTSLIHRSPMSQDTQHIPPWLLSNTERIMKLRNRFAGKQCIVMCSGPSIKKVDLTSFEHHPHVMGVNGTFLLRNRYSHYFCSDVPFALNNMLRITQIDTDYFVFRQEIHRHCVAAGIDINKTIFLSGDKGVESAEIQVDLTERLPWGPTVLLGVVFPTLIWEGFEEIILLGADFPRANYQRFYDSKDGGAIHRNMASQSLEQEMELAHVRLRQWASYLKEHHPKVTVLNCSLESETDAFPKVEFSSVPLRF